MLPTLTPRHICITLLLYTTLCYQAVTAFPYHVTRMTRSSDNTTINLIDDLHIEDIIPGTHALNSSVDAYCDLFVQLNKQTQLTLIWEHTPKINLLPGEDFFTYEKQDQATFVANVKPRIPLQNFLTTINLSPQAKSRFESVYACLTQDTTLWGRDISEAPHHFISQLAYQIRAQTTIPFRAADSERNSLVTYYFLDILTNAIDARCRAMTQATDNALEFEQIKNSAEYYLVNLFILINKIRCSQTAIDILLANKKVFSPHDHDAITKIWHTYTQHVNEVYNGQFSQLVETFFADFAAPTIPCAYIASFFNKLIELRTLKDLIKDGMVEFELLCATLAGQTKSKILYAGGCHNEELIKKFELLGFTKTKELGKPEDDVITADWLTYTVNAPHPTYTIGHDATCPIAFTKELTPEAIRQFLMSA
jgi:hypothetical protein